MISATDTPEVRELVEGLAKFRFDDGDEDQVEEVFFEHGCWWVRLTDVDDRPRFYTVVDAEPGLDDSGLDFEEV